MHLFKIPPFFHKSASQPIQKFGVRRFSPLSAEVLRRVDEAAAEVALPDLIHQYASGQRVLSIDKPAGEHQAVPWTVGGKRRKEVGYVGRHFRPRPSKVA